MIGAVRVRIGDGAAPLPQSIENQTSSPCAFCIPPGNQCCRSAERSPMDRAGRGRMQMGDLSVRNLLAVETLLFMSLIEKG